VRNQLSKNKEHIYKKPYKELVFENEVRNNTDYTVVNGPLYQELINTNVESPTYERFRHVNTTDFKKQLDRPDISNPTGSHEERFNISDIHLNSKFLTTTPTVKSSNPLGNQVGRRTDFI